MKLIEVIVAPDNVHKISAIAERQGVENFRLGPADELGLHAMHLLASNEKVQPILDAVQGVISIQQEARVLVLPVDISLPKRTDEERRKEGAAPAAREALYDSAEKDAQLDWNYVILVVLSTLVAAIGLLEDSVAVVIGAMVIAPLLGPNIAFGLGTALGDMGLMRRAFSTLGAGILIAMAISIVIGLLWPLDTLSPELMARTEVNLAAVVLALASGAAAALSLITGLSSVLVGVMVAVALLPPASTLGIAMGLGRWDLAAGAGLLLAINIVCVNLACKLVFLFRGIAPLSWWQKKTARRAMRIYIAVWVLTLGILVLEIIARNEFDL